MILKEVLDVKAILQSNNMTLRALLEGGAEAEDEVPETTLGDSIVKTTGAGGKKETTTSMGSDDIGSVGMTETQKISEKGTTTGMDNDDMGSELARVGMTETQKNTMDSEKETTTGMDTEVTATQENTIENKGENPKFMSLESMKSLTAGPERIKIRGSTKFGFGDFWTIPDFRFFVFCFFGTLFFDILLSNLFLEIQKYKHPNIQKKQSSPKTKKTKKQSLEFPKNNSETQNPAFPKFVFFGFSVSWNFGFLELWFLGFLAGWAG